MQAVIFNHFQERENLQGLPSSPNGMTSVYFSQQSVFKDMKQEREALRRLRNVKKVCSLLNKEDSHVIVAQAWTRGPLLVEERLQINVNRYYNMWLYSTKGDLFDAAVRELVGVFTQIFIGDLLSPDQEPSTKIQEAKNEIRYDNICYCFSKEGGVKVALIDLGACESLEDSEEVEEEKEGEEYYIDKKRESLQTLARIFSRHLPLIKKELEKLGIEKPPQLEDFAMQGNKCLQRSFVGHLQWLKKKQVFNYPNFSSFCICKERYNKCTQRIRRQLLGLCTIGMQILGLCTIGMQKRTKISRLIASTILSNFQVQIRRDQEERLKQFKERSTLEIWEVVEWRSPILWLSHLYAGVDKHIELVNKGNKEDPASIVEQCVFIVLKELKGKEIFSFYPRHLVCQIKY